MRTLCQLVLDDRPQNGQNCGRRFDGFTLCDFTGFTFLTDDYKQGQRSSKFPGA